jgi:NitT/TauT family transport system substrate-binding protein
MNPRIGHLSTFYHTAVILMARKEAEDRLGTEVDWRLFGTGPAIMEAFRRGELDLAYVGLPPAIIGIAAGAAVKCVAGGHMEGTVITGRREDKGFPETEDLQVILSQYAGQRIGVPGTGSIHDVIAAEILERYPLDGQIEIVNFKWADDVMEAFIAGQLSGAIGTPALAVALRRYGDGKLLYPANRLWPQNPSYGIVADTTFLKDRVDLVERFLELHEAAASLLRDFPAESAQVIADFVGIVDADFVRETLDVSPRYCAQLTDGYISCTMAFVKTLKRLGYIAKEPSVEDIFDLRHIAKVHGPGDHYGDMPAKQFKHEKEKHHG